MKPGYKLTEVGVIPEDWQAVQLGQKIEISHGFPFASQHFVEHGQYMLTTPGNFYEDGGFRYLGAKQKYYAGPIPDNYLLKSGDLIVAMTEQADGLLGSAALIHDSGTYLHNQRLGRVKLSCTDVDASFLFYVFNSTYYRCKVRETAAGTKVKHTSPEKLCEIQIAIPSINEQRAIATALSNMDGLISGLDQLIAKKRDIKQAAMQQLLTGQQRLPGFSGPWELKRLDDIAIIDPESLTGNTSPDYEFNYISLEDVDTGRLQGHTEMRFSDAPSRARRKLRANDILVSTVRPNLMSHLLFSEPEKNWVCSTGFSVIRCANEVASPNFIYPHFFGSVINNQIDKIITGSNYPAINSADVRALEILIPSYSEQIVIATILSDMDRELAALETRRDKARQLKQGMMQELLTGRIRLL